ncbi:hypothetical protein HOF78_03840 [Candidatus Woesearchaeota archaeon]|jgi:hypothetical protein|nr:hypothetical protein [Candidatus Woesearchaeota archaeon]MBT6044724.1 hypothetical protein [Candidatus Woesearchaeota archaeon]
MNMKQVTNLLIIGLFVIIGAIFASALTVTITAPTTDTFHIADISFTATITDAFNFSNYTLIVHAPTTPGTAVFTETNITAGNATDIAVTIPVANGTIADGNYTINITTNDNQSVGITFVNRTNVLLNKMDVTAPTGHIQFLETDGTNLTSSLKSDYGADVKVNCTFLDASSSLDVSKSYMTIKYPGLSSYSDNLTLSKNTTAQVVATISGSSLQRLGEFSVKCFAQDNAGKTLEKVLNFTTQTIVVGAGSTAGGTGVAAIEGWENPVGTIKIGSGTVSPGGRLTTEGESRLMKTNAAITFDISGEGHRIEVKTATGDNVVLTISSEPFDVTINAGEVSEVDVNGDGIADLEVTYHKLFANAWADLTFKQISVPVEAEASDDEASAETTAATEDTAEYADANGGLTVTLAVIVIILIIGYALIKGKKK